MKDLNFVKYTFMIESREKEKENVNKNQTSQEYNGGKFEKDQEGTYKIQTEQIKKNEGSTSKCPIKEGENSDYHVQQGVRESTMDSSNTTELTITPLNKNKEKSYKNVIQNERSKEYNESKKEKEQEISFEEKRLQKQQQQDINDELELNIIAGNNSLSNNTNHIQKDNNINSGSKFSIGDEKDQNYYRLKQGLPRSIKFRSIIDTYKNTKRLSLPQEEYNWSRPSTLKNLKFEVQNEGKMGKDQVNTIKEILLNKQKRKIIHGEFESLDEHSQKDNSNHTLMEDNRSNIWTKENKDEDDHLNKGISESTIFKSLFDLCEVIIQHETSEEHDRSTTRKDHKDSMEEELQEEQQQQNDITGEPELNKVIGEDSLPNINPDCVLNDNDSNCGSKLLTRDENDGNYCITQGIPRSIKFRSIGNLYECTTRFSPVEGEYNWNISRGEYSNMNHLKKEDSSDKKIQLQEKI